MTPSRPRHVPLRRCVRCRRSLPKQELVRLRRDDDRQWRLDPTGKAGGRGAWLCVSCAREAKERDLRRAFRGQAETVMEQLDAHVPERREAREE